MAVAACRDPTPNEVCANPTSRFGTHGAAQNNDGTAESRPRRCFVGRVSAALDEGEEEVFLVVGVGLDVDLAFAGEPADCGEHFLVFEFGFLFELFEAEYVGGREGVPYEAGP